jgi:hypothetical protein
MNLLELDVFLFSCQVVIVEKMPDISDLWEFAVTRLRIAIRM